MKVGVVGASGYAGVELLRLCAAHPELEVVVATAGSHRGQAVAAHTPSLAAAYPDLTYAPTEPPELDGLDLVFLALPHGQSQHLVPDLVPTGSGWWSTWPPTSGFTTRRCTRSGTARSTWRPSCSGQFVYGLPELHRDELSGRPRDRRPRLLSRRPPSWPWPRWSGPGCWPSRPATAGPDGSPPLIVDAASGVSGAGRAPKDNLHFGTVDEDFVAYGLLDHRHTAEMEQGLGTTGPVHPPPGPDGAGHPGHLLRPSAPTGRIADHRRTPWSSSTRPTTTSPSWWSPTARRRPRPPAGRTAPT